MRRSRFTRAQWQRWAHRFRWCHYCTFSPPAGDPRGTEARWNQHLAQFHPQAWAEIQHIHAMSKDG
jgi:hypothetical protein